MSTTPYTTTLGVLQAAAAAAPAGSKRTATAQALSDDIGSGWRLKITKDSTTHFNGTFTGALPRVGEQIIVNATQATTITTNTAMTLTGGTIVVAIEKASDSSRGFSGSGGGTGSGADAIISAALDGSASPAFTIVISFNNIADSTTAPSSNDSRVRLWVSPLMSNVQLGQRFGWLAIQNNSAGNDTDCENLPDNYLDPATGQLRLGRVDDPVRGVPYRAFRMRVGDGFTPRNDTTYRAAFATPWSKSSPDGSMVCEFGKTYWIAWALKIDTDCFQITPGDPNLEINVVDFHHTDNSTGGSQTPFCTFVTASGYRITRRYNDADDGVGSGIVDDDVYTDTSEDSTNWHYFAAHFKPHWDPGENPFQRVWRRIGLTGTVTQIVDEDGPNAYKNTDVDEDFVAPKFGVYRWEDVWGSQLTRTVHHKGFFMLEDLTGTPTLNQAAMLAIMDAV